MDIDIIDRHSAFSKSIADLEKYIKVQLEAGFDLAIHLGEGRMTLTFTGETPDGRKVKVVKELV